LHAQELGPITLIVQDADGKAVAGAEVHCVNWDNELIRETPLQDAEKGTTDAEGRVTFPDKTIGQVFVRVIAGDQGGWFRVHDHGEPTVVTLTVGTGHTLRGAVRDVNGEPMTGVQILADGCLPAGETDEAGRFAVPNSGITYSPELVFAKEGYAPEGTSVHFDANEVTISLKRSVDIQVRVIYPDGTPAAEASAGGDVRWSRYLRTDKDGRFTIADAPVGDEIGISATARRDETTYRGNQRFVVPPESPELVTLTLDPVYFGTVKGRFIHVDSGEPVIGRVFMDTSNEFYSPQERTHTDDEGRFTFEEIWPGPYWIFAAPTKPTLFQVGGPQQVMVGEDGGDVTLEITIDEGCAIRGTVLTSDGKPVEQCQVMWRPMPHYRAIWTDGAGHFVIPHLEGVGLTYTVEVTDQFQRVAKATIGPMEKGQIVSDVELRLPAAMKPAVLRGTVVDPEGEPLPNIRLHFLYEEGVEPRSVSATTNENGTFEMNVVNSGAVKVSANRGVQIQRDTHNDNISVECEIVGTDTVQLSAERDETLQFVVKPQTLRMLTGRVVDPAGRPVQAQVQILHGEWDSESGNFGGGEGEFTFRRLPEEPYVLEVTAQGHKARVLKAEDLTYSPTQPFIVTLEPGPFAIGDSVWASVTGTPPTPESVARFPLAERIRKNEWQYYRNAEPPKPQDPSVTERMQSYRKRLRVLDATGKPVKRVYLEPMYSLPSPEVRVYAPDPGMQPQSLTSADGIYDMPMDYGAIVSSPESGRVLVKSEWSNQPDETMDVVLHEAASIELQVAGSEGKSEAGVPVYIGDMAWDHPANARAYNIGETDSEGRVRFSRLPAGFHGFAIGALGSTMQLVLVDLQPGETRVEEVELSGHLSDDPRSRLQRWRESFRDQIRREASIETLRSELEAMGARERRRLNDAICEGLAVLPDDIRWNGWVSNELRLYTAIATALGSRESVPLLKEVLINLRSGQRGIAYMGPPEIAGSIAETIIALEGDEAVVYFAELAKNPNAEHAARIAALVSLGRIGTQQSASAFAKIRDAAYGAANAPERRESYTHAERMAETAHMVLWVLSRAEVARPFDLDAYNGATVSEDYTTGTLSTTTMGGWTELRFRRLGEEWLLTEIGGTAVV
jgi:protocatechuate 3,4-dioxygenase beta subunit